MDFLGFSKSKLSLIIRPKSKNMLCVSQKYWKVFTYARINYFEIIQRLDRGWVVQAKTVIFINLFYICNLRIIGHWWWNQRVLVKALLVAYVLNMRWCHAKLSSFTVSSHEHFATVCQKYWMIVLCVDLYNVSLLIH